jgi:hypothetical protein
MRLPTQKYVILFYHGRKLETTKLGWSLMALRSYAVLWKYVIRTLTKRDTRRQKQRQKFQDVFSLHKKDTTYIHVDSDSCDSLSRKEIYPRPDILQGVCVWRESGRGSRWICTLNARRDSNRFSTLFSPSFCFGYITPLFWISYSSGSWNISTEGGCYS